MRTELSIMRIAGIPVAASIWFLVLLGSMVLTAYELWVGLLWALAVALSLLWHELGHGLLALGYRLRPRILLHGFGGLCIHDRPRRDTQAMSVAAAGPLFGLVLGVTLYVLGLFLFPGGRPSSGVQVFWSALVEINIGWSLANLLPIFPLDGGQLYRLVLVRRMDPVRAELWTFGTGLGLATVVLLGSLGSGLGFMPVIALLLVYENSIRLHRVRRTGVPTIPPNRSYEEGSSGPASVDERDGQRGGVGGFATRAVLWLIGANFLVWIVFRVAAPQSELAKTLYTGGWLVPGEAVFDLHLWQLVTYQWLHDLNNGGHVLANCLGLFFLGPVLERRWGTRDFLRFYLLTGLIAGVVSTLVALLLPGIFDPGTSIVGASGAVMGLLAALSLTMPELELQLLLVIPIKAKYIVWVALGLDTLFWLAPGSDLAWQTHVGGVLGAWLLITGSWRPGLVISRIHLWWLHLKQRRRKAKLRVIDGGRDDRRYLH
jgi:membrane associated rhomboid family serine protease/Zn-dependent protease